MKNDVAAENFIVRNLESGFLEIHIKSKDTYLKLSSTNREILKNKFRWSRPENCWVSKAQFDLCKAVAKRFVKLGYSDQGWKGSRIPFEKKVIQRLNKNLAIANKCELQAQRQQKIAARHIRAAEHKQQLLKIETDRFKKQDLKRKIETSSSNAVQAMERASHYKSEVVAIHQRIAVLELNLSNPKFLKGKLYKTKMGPLFKQNGTSEFTTPPLADKLQGERLLFLGRFKTEQEQTVFYRNRLRNIIDKIPEDLSIFYGKPVSMSKRFAEDGIGSVVGYQPDGKLVLKVTDGSYMAMELGKLKVLAPAYEILNLLQSRHSDISEKTKAEGLKALALMHKDRPLEAMDLIQKVGLTKQCMIKCDQYLKTQLELKKSVKRSKVLGI